MTTRSQRDALSLLVLTTRDKVFDCSVSHGPRGSIFGGSGVGDMIPLRASTGKVYATARKQIVESDAMQSMKRHGYAPCE
jgi:hypothetical protein